MSQFDLSTLSPSDSGNTLVSSLDSFSAAFLSNNSGATRPSYAVEGTIWTKIVSATLRQVYYYDGDTDFLLFTYNPVANTFVIDSDTLNGFADYARTIVNASDPGAVGAYNYWIDTTAGLIKQRNAANSGWITIGKSNVDGLLLTGSGNPNGVVTGNFEGQQYYDTTNDLLWVYAGSSTVWYSIGGIKSGSLPTNYHDVNIEFLTAATIRITSGSRCRSTDDTKDIIFTSDYTIDMSNATPTSTTGGRSVAEAANTWYYLYVGLTSTGLPLAWLDTANLAGGGSPTNPAAYSSGRRQLRFIVRNNASLDIMSFTYDKFRNLVVYKDYESTETYIVLSGGQATTFTAVSCASLVPPISTNALLRCGFSHDSNTISRNMALRETGSGHTVGDIIYQNASAYSGSVTFVERSLNSSQQFDYKGSVGAPYMLTDIHVKGFIITEVP
jgi:hypothetical protein